MFDQSEVTNRQQASLLMMFRCAVLKSLDCGGLPGFGRFGHCGSGMRRPAIFEARTLAQQGPLGRNYECGSPEGVLPIGLGSEQACLAFAGWLRRAIKELPMPAWNSNDPAIDMLKGLFPTLGTLIAPLVKIVPVNPAIHGVGAQRPVQSEKPVLKRLRALFGVLRADLPRLAVRSVQAFVIALTVTRPSESASSIKATLPSPVAQH